MKAILRYLRFILPHLGIVSIVLAMVLGCFYNWRGKAVLLTTDKTNVFITKNKEIKITPYALTLANFKADFYNSGEPKSLEAFIKVEENNEIKTILLRVNHPCRMGFGQNLYLTNYAQHSENPELCVVELVYDPFQGLFLSGIILVITNLCYLCAKKRII